jgi:hypothetical protein
MPATRVACVPKNFFRLLSPSIRSVAAPRSEPRASASGTRRAGYPIVIIAKRRRNQCRCLRIHPGPHGPSTPWPLFLRFPPKSRTAPTHARHKSCSRKKSPVSPYVTLNSVAPHTVRRPTQDTGEHTYAPCAPPPLKASNCLRFDVSVSPPFSRRLQYSTSTFLMNKPASAQRSQNESRKRR